MKLNPGIITMGVILAAGAGAVIIASTAAPLPPEPVAAPPKPTPVTSTPPSTPEPPKPWYEKPSDMRSMCENEIYKTFRVTAPFRTEGTPIITKTDKGYVMLGFTGMNGGNAQVKCIGTLPADFRIEGAEGDTLEDVNAAVQTTIPSTLKVESWRCETASSDYMKIIGEVTNQSSSALENIEARGQVKDDQGLIAKSETLIDYKMLRPGETSPFEVLIDTGGRTGNCYLSFGAFFGDSIDTDFPQ